jgi:hypothetical protein
MLFLQAGLEIALYTSNWEVLGSNLGWDTRYPDQDFIWFPLFLQANPRIIL